MNDSIFRISLDIHEHGSQAVLKVKKTDTGRKLYITLRAGGIPYIIEDDCYAVFKATKPDGSILYNACTIENNMIIYEFTEQTCTAVGKCRCEIALYGMDDKLITSPRFALLVDGTIYPDEAVESTDEFSALAKQISDAMEATGAAAKAAQNAGEAAVVAGESADRANAATENANLATGAANQATGNANEAAEAANKATENAKNASDNANKAAEEALTAAEGANKAAEDAQKATDNVKEEASKWDARFAECVTHTEQALTKEQKAQARFNIGAGGQIVNTAEGKHITLTDGAYAPVRDLKVYVPANTEGVNSLAFSACGKNIAKPVPAEKRYATPILPKDTAITISCTVSESGTYYFYFEDAQGNQAGWAQIENAVAGTRYATTIKTTKDGGCKLMLYGQYDKLGDLQMEIGKAATDYVPFDGVIHTVELPEASYGGYVDWVKGEYVKTHDANGALSDSVVFPVSGLPEVYTHYPKTRLHTSGESIRVGYVADTKEYIDSYGREHEAFIKKVCVNLFDGACINGFFDRRGFYDSGNYLSTKPMKLKAGTYLWNPQSGVFGDSARCVAKMDEAGVMVKCIVGEYLKNTDTEILAKVEIPEDGLYCFNIGYSWQDHKSGFMVVAGSEAADFPTSYYPHMTEIEPGISIPAMPNPLFQKVLLFNGDSICMAYGDSKSGYAGRIAEKYSAAHYKNYGVGGGTITQNVVGSDGNTKHSVCGSVAKMYSEYPNADYIILEGGTNDADILGEATGETKPERFGTFTAGDFSGNYDTDTFCGAMEKMLYDAVTLWRGKKIGFIVAQKMGDWYVNGYHTANRYAYFQTAMEICKKWGVPVLNLWDDSYLCPSLTAHYDKTKTAEENVAAGSLYTDGQHLTAAGYDYIAGRIGEWMLTL